jgi:hypothetical protein
MLRSAAFNLFLVCFEIDLTNAPKGMERISITKGLNHGVRMNGDTRNTSYSLSALSAVRLSAFLSKRTLSD